MLNFQGLLLRKFPLVGFLPRYECLQKPLRVAILCETVQDTHKSLTLLTSLSLLRPGIRTMWFSSMSPFGWAGSQSIDISSFV